MADENKGVGNSSHEENLLTRFVVQYGANIWIRTVSLLTIIVFYVKFLNETAIGIVILVLFIFEVVAIVSDCGFSQLATVRLGSADASWTEAMVGGLQTRLFGAGGLLLAAILVALLTDAAWGWSAVVMASALIPFAWVQNARAYWNGRRRLGRMMQATAVAYTIGAAASILLAWQQADVAFVLGAQALSFWLEWVLIFSWCRLAPEHVADARFLRLFSLPSGREFRRHLQAALPFGLFTIMWVIYLRLDVFLQAGINPGEIAGYGIALKFYSFALTLIQGGAFVVLSDSQKIEAFFRRIPLRGAHLAILLTVAALGVLTYLPMFLVTFPKLVQIGLQEEVTRTLIASGYLQATSLILATLALGGRKESGRYLWPIFMAASGLIVGLTCVQNAYCETVWWEWNRLLTDLVIFSIVGVLYWRETKTAKPDP